MCVVYLYWGLKNKGNLNPFRRLKPDYSWNLRDLVSACIFHHTFCIHTAFVYTHHSCLVTTSELTCPQSKTCIHQIIPMGIEKKQKTYCTNRNFHWGFFSGCSVLLCSKRPFHSKFMSSNLSFLLTLTFHTQSSANIFKQDLKWNLWILWTPQPSRTECLFLFLASHYVALHSPEVKSLDSILVKTRFNKLLPYFHLS